MYLTCIEILAWDYSFDQHRLPYGTTYPIFQASIQGTDFGRPPLLCMDVLTVFFFCFLLFKPYPCIMGIIIVACTLWPKPATKGRQSTCLIKNLIAAAQSCSSGVYNFTHIYIYKDHGSLTNSLENNFGLGPRSRLLMNLWHHCGAFPQM